MIVLFDGGKITRRSYGEPKPVHVGGRAIANTKREKTRGVRTRRFVNTLNRLRRLIAGHPYDNITVLFNKRSPFFDGYVLSLLLLLLLRSHGRYIKSTRVLYTCRAYAKYIRVSREKISFERIILVLYAVDELREKTTV